LAEKDACDGYLDGIYYCQTNIGPNGHFGRLVTITDGQILTDEQLIKTIWTENFDGLTVW